MIRNLWATSPTCRDEKNRGQDRSRIVLHMTRTRTSLIRRVGSSQDAAGWAEFVQLYEPLLFSYVRARGLSATEAPDVVQEIFIKLLKALPKFTLDHQRGRFRTWLYQVTMTVVIDRVRSRKAREGHVKEWWDRHGKNLTGEEEPDQDWNLALRRRVLTHAQDKVKLATNTKTWYCYEERFLKNRPCADIAQELEITPNAVGVNAGRVLEKISALCMDYLEDFDDE